MRGTAEVPAGIHRPRRDLRYVAGRGRETVMGRPNRRPGCGRVTPKGTPPAARRGRRSGRKGRSIHRNVSPEERLRRSLLETAAAVAADPDGLETAELWASSVQAIFRCCGHHDGACPTVDELLGYAAADGTAAGAMIAAALSVFGPPEGRPSARDLYGTIAEQGTRLPEWLPMLGAASPLRARRMFAEWGDWYVLVVDYVRPAGASSSLSLLVDRLWTGQAYGLKHHADPLEAIDRLDVSGVGDTESVTLTDARATIEAALAAWDAAACDEDSERFYDGFDEDLHAFAMQRASLLPTGGAPLDEARPTERQVARLVKRFARGTNVAPTDAVKGMLERVCRFARRCNDGDPLRWTPEKIGRFLADYLPNTVIVGDGWYAQMEPIFAAWLDYCAAERDLDRHMLAVNVATATETFEMLRDGGDADFVVSPKALLMREMIADGVDLTGPDAGTAARAWQQSRNAAVPTPAQTA